MSEPHKPSTSMHLLVLLADFLANACRYCEADVLQRDGLSADVIARLATAAPFQKHLSRVLRADDGADIDIPADFRDRLKTDAELQLALRISLASLDDLLPVCQHLAGAIFSKQIMSLVLKRQRDKVAAALGDAAMETAIRQSDMFFAALRDLAPANADDMIADTARTAPEPSTHLSEDEDTDTAVDDPEQGNATTPIEGLAQRVAALSPVHIFAFQCLGAALTDVHPVIGAIFGRRFGPAALLPTGADQSASSVALDQIHRNQIFTLCRRKGPAWSTFTD